ncbi:MAG: metalloregulator ArsR/SmtB family transcription factor [Phycisphaerae bacterium]
MTQKRKRLPATPKLAAACARPIDDMLKPELFKALCDPTRLKLLACLAKCGRLCAVGEVAECCSVDLSVVSRHLSMLSRAGILKVQRKSRTVLYGVEYSQLCHALRSLADAVEDCCPGRPASRARACCGEC